MIRNGRRGGATSYSCIRSGMASRRNAARPAATPSANRPSASSTTQVSRALVYRIRTVTGAAAASAIAKPRTRPLLVSAHHTPAKVSARPANPTSTRAKLWRTPATTGATSTAAEAATRARRASHRWATVAPPGASTSRISVPAIALITTYSTVPSLPVSLDGRQPSSLTPNA
jgi:hypothetical protein